MSYPAISLTTPTVGRHRRPQKRLQTVANPPSTRIRARTIRVCYFLSPFQCPLPVHPCPSVDSGLAAAATERAGGPGAFYIGDLNQLVGPAPAEGLGDATDMVTLAGLERERYIFDSQYYRDLVEKANFTNPTEMIYDGDPIKIQFACINRTVAPCELWDHFFKKQVEERTNGKIQVPITSFPELGIAGPDSLNLISNGSLSFAEISSSYVSGAMPEAELQILFGVYETHEHYLGVQEAIGPLVDSLFVNGGDKVGRVGGRLLSIGD